MSDLRHDQLENVWVTMAGNRVSRPMEFVPLEQIRQQIICPFCRGNEIETPRELAAYGTDGKILNGDRSNWLVRVVANKYPSYTTGDEVDTLPSQPDSTPFRTSSAHGIQEIIIPSSRHLTSISELSDQELEVSFQVHQHRLNALREQEHVRHGMLFLNCRSAAGASLGHIHWQLIGSPVISAKMQNRNEINDAYRGNHNQSLLRDLTDWEVEQQTRVLGQTEHFDIVCPFASRFPFQVRIIPRDPTVKMSNCSDAIRNELAVHCRNVVQRLETLLDQPAYNILLHQSTFDRLDRDPWYVEIFPRLTKPAGFEWGTDIWVNPVAPETAANALRAAEENRK